MAIAEIPEGMLLGNGYGMLSKDPLSNEIGGGSYYIEAFDIGMHRAMFVFDLMIPEVSDASALESLDGAEVDLNQNDYIAGILSKTDGKKLDFQNGHLGNSAKPEYLKLDESTGNIIAKMNYYISSNTGKSAITFVTVVDIDKL